MDEAVNVLLHGLATCLAIVQEAPAGKLANSLKVTLKHMNNMLARLTAKEFLHRLAFLDRATLRCISPEISLRTKNVQRRWPPRGVQRNDKEENKW